jgi:putative endonuclease
VKILQSLKEMFTGAGPSLSTGTAGERRAEKFLKQLGYRVIARNWRNPSDRRDELDLVCRDGEVLVFVEVKTRSSIALVSGYYAIDRRKKKALRRAADAYLKCLAPGQRPRTFRLDVVEVSTDGSAGGAEVRHFENVPLFPKYYAP